MVTQDAFVAMMSHLGQLPVLASVSQGLAARSEVTGPGAQLLQALLNNPIPPFILDPIRHAVDSLGLWERNPHGIIVRSSATVEDSAAHSFAGIFESLPVMTPDTLEATIRTVWSSMFSPRALAYFQEIGLHSVPGMAVVIQRFLAAERSGVMFTRFLHPDGRPAILVEHVEGDCEKLVRGAVTPERLWLDGPDSVTETLEGSLRPSHARELARLAARLEEDFGCPQDVEWVIALDILHVVQSRPITGLDVSTQTQRVDAAPCLTGTAASPGLASGPVHLVFNIEQALELNKGQVLVTPMTNPDMVVAMCNSAAIVTDVGGMICHAAIVSRELGLPCVVGAETATTTLKAGDTVTVDGFRGAVYRGAHVLASPAPALRRAEWADVWALWLKAARGRTDLVPVVPTAGALHSMPAEIQAAVLVLDLDLRADQVGLWQDLEAMVPESLRALLDRYFAEVVDAIRGRSLSKLYLLPMRPLPLGEIAEAVLRLDDPRFAFHHDDADAPPIRLAPPWPSTRAAVPLGSAAAVLAGASKPAVGGMDEARAAALDTIRFFGHKPSGQVTGMPDPVFRARWWALLPEYGRFHQEFRTETERGEFEWLNVRPELVISALLKSLVQPGFEMVPRVLGFSGMPPLHIKWIKCRYHFRATSFTGVWQAIVRATWDEPFMVDLMRRVRASYEQLRAVLVLFPATAEEAAGISGEKIVALITSWWPRWVEFFALCWFIQAQGDDIVYPFIEETVGANLAGLGPAGSGFAWPSAPDLVAPTTPVLSAEYMAGLARFREGLIAAGLHTADRAESELARGEYSALATQLAEHLRKWHWMRDRDLLFEPWDTPRRVIATALKTEKHSVVPYAENLQRQMMALGFHSDLAQASGRGPGLNYAVRFLHDLNVERENHHVLWLKYSYPLRRLVLEIERRLIAAGSLATGDIFFLQAPELIEAARNLPAPLSPDLVARVKNRRNGFLSEARLAGPDAATAVPEDDYY